MKMDSGTRRVASVYCVEAGDYLKGDAQIARRSQACQLRYFEIPRGGVDEILTRTTDGGKAANLGLLEQVMGRRSNDRQMNPRVARRCCKRCPAKVCYKELNSLLGDSVHNSSSRVADSTVHRKKKYTAFFRLFHLANSTSSQVSSSSLSSWSRGGHERFPTWVVRKKVDQTIKCETTRLRMLATNGH
jgi:hypothetical protein